MNSRYGKKLDSAISRLEVEDLKRRDFKSKSNHDKHIDLNKINQSKILRQDKTLAQSPKSSRSQKSSYSEVEDQPE